MKGCWFSRFSLAAGFAVLLLCVCLIAAPVVSASAQTPIKTADLPADLAAVLTDNLKAGGSIYHAEVYAGADKVVVVLTLLSKDLRSGKDVQIVLRPADGDDKATAELAAGRYYKPVKLSSAVEHPVAEAVAVVQRE